MTTLGKKPLLVIVGQTPPPWHGQAVATQLLFDAKWDGYDVRTVRMAFSSEMEEIGRVQFRKGIHMLDLWKSIRSATRGHEDGILLYPPASPNWVPVLRDLILLPCIRRRFKTVVYIYHAGGVGEWCAKSTLRRWIARIAYGQADLSLEVARESPSPHEVLGARKWAWTPYGVQVPALIPKERSHSGPTVVLFVGSLQEGKGVIEVIKTASLLKKQGREKEFRFRIVGKWFSQAFENDIRHLRAELELETMVEFPGQLTGSEKWQAYSEADVFFFPTHYSSEAFPLVLIEALGSGLPVVTTRWRGIPDLFDGCSVARLCAVHSPAEYVDALLTFRKLASEGIDFAKEARSFYEERYLPENFLAQIQSLVSASSNGIAVHQTAEAPQQQGRRAMLPVPLAGGPGMSPPHSTRVPIDEEPVLQLPAARSFGGPVREEGKSERETTEAFAPTETPKHRNTEAPVLQSPAARCVGESVRETRNTIGDRGSVIDLGPSDSSSANQQSSILNPQSSIPPSSSTDLLPPDSSSPSSSQRFSVSASQHLHLTVYLADQNPGHDRSFGISRMSQVVLEALHASGRVRIGTITSETSQQAPAGVESTRTLPWGTRRKWIRFLTDHFHPLFTRSASAPDAYYFPKGYLPLLSGICRPSVVTIHDTIIQYDADHYPQWRKRREYTYWAMMLKHTLRKAHRILTVSESSKLQIREFMERHGIQAKEITVTYEPCLYERIPQPVAPAKENYVIHLASCEPHKRTAHLIRWWHEAESQDRNLPMLHLIGTVPPEVESLLASSHSIVKSPFLEEAALQAAYRSARALVLPSEIEGFGLPALEAYYLGTPVCFVRGTSVEEILSVATTKGGFALESPGSLWSALDEVMAMPAREVCECGLKLRETYAAAKVAERMVAVFDEVRN